MMALKDSDKLPARPHDASILISRVTTNAAKQKNHRKRKVFFSDTELKKEVVDIGFFDGVYGNERNGNEKKEFAEEIPRCGKCAC
jgi:hypothetical protein